MTPGDAVVVRSAFQSAFGRCLRSHGYEYEEPAQESSAAAPPPDEFRYPPLDAVRRYGYHAERADKFVQPNPTSPPVTLPPFLQDTSEDAVGTVCGKEAERAVGDREYRLRTTGLSSENLRLTQGVDASSEMQTLFAVWSTCMDGAGFAFSRPVDARVYASSAALDTIPPPETVVALAQADYECQRKARLRETAHKLTQEARRKWIEQHPTLLTEVAEQIRIILAKCQAILAGNP